MIADLSKSIKGRVGDAKRIVVQQVALIESGAYHSRGFPGNWSDELPSSKAAKAFVQETLIPKAQRGEALIFVWRRAKFWDIPEDGDRCVMVRPPEKAQLKNLTAKERTRIVEFLAARDSQC